ncbi:MAG: cysteine hydrolase [Pseudomonadota bacterium]|nr:cysteine hydrolase [Pseudomonadota bacterium]
MTSPQKRPALLLIDLINHFEFPGGDALGRATRRIVPAVLRLRDRFDAAGLPVVYANDNWMQWQGGFPDLVTACTEAGGDAAYVAARVAPCEGHYYVLKPKHSAFLASPLPVLLGQLRADALVLAGVATDSCILATAMDANMRDYPLWVPADCTAAISTERKRRALRTMQESMRVSTLASGRSGSTFSRGSPATRTSPRPRD